MKNLKLISVWSKVAIITVIYFNLYNGKSTENSIIFFLLIDVLLGYVDYILNKINSEK